MSLSCFWSHMESCQHFIFSYDTVSEVAQSYPTLWDLMDCSPPGSSVHGISQAWILEWVASFLLQGIFPTQGLNPGLPHCRQTLYCLSYQGSKEIAIIVGSKLFLKIMNESWLLLIFFLNLLCSCGFFIVTVKSYIDFKIALKSESEAA